MFDSIISRSFQNWISWDQKLGHQTKLKEKVFNTLEATILK